MIDEDFRICPYDFSGVKARPFVTSDQALRTNAAATTGFLRRNCLECKVKILRAGTFLYGLMCLLIPVNDTIKNG
jgi:hypothetical protein